MNIQSFIPTAHARVYDEGRPLETLVADLMRVRLSTFQRFGAIEVANGGRREVFQPLWSKAGQDTARNFLMRCIEELLEAAESSDPDHRLEELVDSFFYLISIRLMDPALSVVLEPKDEVEQMLWDLMPGDDLFAEWAPAHSDAVTTRLGHYDLPANFLAATSAFLASLRNRTWQNQVQQPYFTGHHELRELVESWLANFLPAFGSVANFLVFCEAKHDVLIFRLDTHY